MSKRQLIEIEGRELSVSNLDKVFFPKTAFTKGDVIAFYSAIAETVVPHLRARPLTLKRYPDGITGSHFYEKNAPSHKPDWVETFAVPRTEGGGAINYVLCNDKATLVWATNLGDIEKHVLLAQAPDLNRPTAVVFDLDPGEPAGILECGRVALHLKGVFEGLNLQSFVKVSGSKGLHLSVPLNTDVNYELTQPFAKAIAELVEQQLPGEVVSEMAKRIRKGKVLIDWSQNSDFKTTVAVYALRAKREEPFISMPITWEELARAVKRRDEEPLYFTPKQAVKRISKVGDLFSPVLELKQELPTAFTAAINAGPRPKLSRWPRNDKKSTERARDKSLREYAAKRDHSRTPEPAAESDVARTKSKKGVHRFVIQKHAASHLHYDWRLEMQGVLRSWAVPKGPPTQPREARLAMHVEDHPLEYATFEGTIPPGNYGAGTVMVWDQGEYEDITGNPAAAYHAGKMHVVMRGKKLKGEWILVKDRREEEGNRWLLIKAGEPITITKKSDDTSAVSGRSMRQITEDNDAQWQSNRSARSTRIAKRSIAKKPVEPKFIEPMHCKAVAKPPVGDEWSFEIKFDGYRCLAVKHGSTVILYSRNAKKLNDRFPHLASALARFKQDFAMDGEIVALDRKGRPAFQLLQNSSARDVSVFFYAFDLVNLKGEDLVNEPIGRRRELLHQVLASARDPIRTSPLLEAPGEKIAEAVQTLGLEGYVAKRAGSLYESGERSGAWIKQRTNQEQEFVIGGYIPGGHGFDSLLVGVYEGKKLQFVAKVKNGFVPQLRAEIFPQLKKLRVDKCPFANLPEEKSGRWGESLTAEKMKECRWVRPRLVCQVVFVEWTEAGHLRHCSFVAMRDDKKPTEVVRET